VKGQEKSAWMADRVAWFCERSKGSQGAFLFLWGTSIIGSLFPVSLIQPDKLPCLPRVCPFPPKAPTLTSQPCTHQPGLLVWRKLCAHEAQPQTHTWAPCSISWHCHCLAWPHPLFPKMIKVECSPARTDTTAGFLPHGTASMPSPQLHLPPPRCADSTHFTSQETEVRENRDLGFLPPPLSPSSTHPSVTRHNLSVWSETWGSSALCVR
jgi:hypothetical protein